MTRASLSREAQLVLLSAGGPETDAALRVLSGSDQNWGEVARLANRERAASVLWRRLRRLRPALVETEPLHPLAAVAHFWEFRLARLESQLYNVLDAFEREGIAVVLLKGAGLALTVYPAFAERPMADLDLLVPLEDSRHAWELAQELGWRWDEDEYPRTRYAEHHHLPPLNDVITSGSTLEIHTDLFGERTPFELPVSDVWRDAVRHPLGGRTIATPSPSHQVLHSSIHFAWMHHLQNKLWRTVHDVWAYTEADLDWSQAVEQAHRIGADTCVYWTLRLARELADVPVPEGALAGLRPRGPGWALDALARHHAITALPAEAACPSTALSVWLYRASIHRGYNPSLTAVRGLPGTTPGAVGPTSLPRRLANHASDRAAWARYLRSVLRPA